MISLTIGLIVWQYQEYEEGKSKTRILPSEVVLRKISFDPIGNNYQMTGRIYNNSEKYNLSGVQLKIIAKDCVNNNEDNCVIFSETNEYIYISIPPGQARDFKKEIYLYSNQNVENKVVWNYSIEYAESK